MNGEKMFVIMCGICFVQLLLLVNLVHDMRDQNKMMLEMLQQNQQASKIDTHKEGETCLKG